MKIPFRVIIVSVLLNTQLRVTSIRGVFLEIEQVLLFSAMLA